MSMNSVVLFNRGQHRFVTIRPSFPPLPPPFSIEASVESTVAQTAEQNTVRCGPMRPPTFCAEMRVLIRARSTAPSKVTETTLKELSASGVFIRGVHQLCVRSSDTLTALSLQFHLQGSDSVVFQLHDLVTKKRRQRTWRTRV